MSDYNLLVEGVDRVGKSRFINEWVKVFTEFKVIKTLPVLGYEDAVNTFNNLMLSYDEPGFQLHDRSHISEIAYTKMYRRHNVNSVYPDLLFELEAYIDKPTYIVYLYPSDTSIMKADLERTNGLGLVRECKELENAISKTRLPALIHSRHINGEWECAMDTVFKVSAWLQQLGQVL